MPDLRLLEHGTRAFVLPVGAVIGAAQDDLKKVARNKGQGAATFERYSFVRRHVKASRSVDEVIAKAVADLEAGLNSRKISTRMLYRNADVLRDALKLLSGTP